MASWEDKVSIGGVTDHGDLTGLGDDDHTQYLLIDATRAMAGDLNMGNHKITSVTDPSIAQGVATKNYCDTNFNNYSHPSGRVCSSGIWNATSISGVMPVDHGGTGVTDDSYDADKVDGCDAGTSNGNVWKVPATGPGSIAAGIDGGFAGMYPGTDGYQLTCHGDWTALTWSAASDLIFSDTHCPKCGKKFEDGDILVMYVVGHNEVGDTLTIPMHKSCAESPKKTVTIKRKVMEDQYVLDELTGELKVQRVHKVLKKNVTKKRIKEDVELDRKMGEFWHLEDGKRKKKITNTDAIEEFDDVIEEVMYEDVEYEM